MWKIGQIVQQRSWHQAGRPNLSEELRYVKVHLELNGLRSLAAKKVEIGLQPTEACLLPSMTQARTIQRLEQPQKQFDRLQSTLALISSQKLRS